MNGNLNFNHEHELSVAMEELGSPIDLEVARSQELGDKSEGAFVLRSKYFPYHLRVDPQQDDRANEIKLCSIQRPHMRAFHFAWWCYHVAFMMWCVKIQRSFYDILLSSDLIHLIFHLFWY